MSNRSDVAEMDAFTARHLAAWVDAAVYPDDQEAFVAWVTALDADDLGHYCDAGWPAAYSAFCKETGR